MRSATRKAALVALTLAALGGAHAQPAQGTIRYACPASQELVVQRNSSRAHVRLAGRDYDLQRKRSSIGDKYLSSKAALIIDGASAVFVADDRFDLGTCVKAGSSQL
jgi:membrane-bound inhibitor of C-type lysozyme